MNSVRLAGTAIAVFFMAWMSVAAAQPDFPFDQEFLLDARPMKGSKRIPSLEVAENGSATIDLWCDSVQGQFVIVGDTLTIIAASAGERKCPADRVAQDTAMLDALAQVTNWRRDGDTLVLIGGAQPIRFRIATN